MYQKTRQMCTGINNFLNTFYSAVVQMMFWGTCWWVLDKELLVWSPVLIQFVFLSLFTLGQVLLFWAVAGPVVWTINLSHTPLVFWVVVGTLLWCYWKAIEPLGGGGEQCVVGGTGVIIIIIIILFFMCPVSVYLHVWMERAWLLSLFVCECAHVFFFLFFFSWQACA